MHTLIKDAVSECGPGHPAHVTNARNDRIVAIRTGNKPGTFNLTFSDPKVELRDADTKYDVKPAKVEQMIYNFLHGIRISATDNWFDSFINQATRECYVDHLTPTRCRIEYEMPNAGLVGSWRKQTTVNGFTYIQD